MNAMYFVAVILPEAMDKKILLYKKWMAEKFGCTVGLKSLAHITIIPPFWMTEEKEFDLISDLQLVAEDMKIFSITTNNFSVFPPRTLFVAVADNENLNRLTQNVDDYFLEKDYPIKREVRPFHPHVTIATRDLQKKDFAEAWQHFKNKKMTEEFTASGLCLLKHNGKCWTVIYTAPFAANGC